MKKQILPFGLLLSLTLLFACHFDEKANPGLSSNFKAKYVVIVSVDGPRWNETWGDSKHTYIHYREKLAKQGILFTNFQNTGFTATNPGHCAIVTGNHENIDNTGQELPTYPSIFQHYLEASGYSNSACQIITSKDKLDVLANCKMGSYRNKFNAEVDIGVNGQFMGYREDSITFQHALSIFSNKHPRLTLVHFKGPDIMGHQNNWSGYLAAIKETDKYLYDLWSYLQADPIYKDRTAFFVTNDHGRHNNDHNDGFVSHGDACTGCRHIEFLALGPDFAKAQIVDRTNYDQRDISKTIGKLLGFKVPYSQGKEIYELVGN